MTKVIYHYGIKGMRWGIRRKRPTGPPSEDHVTVTNLRKKRTQELSNKELETINKRLNLERNYKSLKNEETSIGQDYVSKFMKNYGKQVVSGLATAAAGATVSIILGKNK